MVKSLLFLISLGLNSLKELQLTSRRTDCFSDIINSNFQRHFQKITQIIEIFTKSFNSLIKIKLSDHNSRSKTRNRTLSEICGLLEAHSGNETVPNGCDDEQPNNDSRPTDEEEVLSGEERLSVEPGRIDTRVTLHTTDEGVREG